MRKLKINVGDPDDAIAFARAVLRLHGDAVVRASISHEGAFWPLEIELQGDGADRAYDELLRRFTGGPD